MCLLFSVPGYISRSVAGSYDNEGIAIFALMFTYFLWVSGSLHFVRNLLNKDSIFKDRTHRQIIDQGPVFEFNDIIS